MHRKLPYKESAKILVTVIRCIDIGHSPSGKAPDFDSGITLVQIQYAQLGLTST